MKLSERLNHMKQHLLDEGDNYGAEVLHHAKERIDNLEEENELLQDALYHSGYDWTDCIDCGGPPHNEYCRFWKLRHLFPLWFEADTQEKDHRRKVTLGTQEFDDLPEYSASLPTWGKYDDGRLLGTAKWKRKTKKGWLFGRATLEGDEVRIDWYEIVLADTK